MSPVLRPVVMFPVPAMMFLLQASVWLMLHPWTMRTPVAPLLGLV